jgi:hypothetical protein
MVIDWERRTQMGASRTTSRIVVHEGLELDSRRALFSQRPR